MKTTIKNEIYRKLFHVSSCIIPLSYVWFIEEKKLLISTLVLLIVIAIIIELLRNHKNFINNIFNQYLTSILRESESNGKITGATWLLISYVITIITFPKPIAIAALIFLSVGDSVAAIVGKIIPIFPIGEKNITGFIGGVITSYLVVLSLNQDLQNSVIFLGAVAAMTIEILPIRINDNLTIPLFSGLVMVIFNSIL